MQNPLRTYQLVAGATGAMLTEKMIFIISHDDEQNQCAVSVYSDYIYMYIIILLCYHNKVEKKNFHQLCHHWRKFFIP